MPDVLRAEGVEDQAVDRTEAAGHLEGIDESRVPRDGNLDPIGTDGADASAQRQASCAMMHELGETPGLETPHKDERRRASHDAGSIRGKAHMTDDVDG